MSKDLISVREPDTHTLGRMLQYRRPEGSTTEKQFIRHFLGSLGMKHDKRGNLIKAIGDNPSVLWSCHTDTVHRKPGYQKLSYEKGIIQLAKGSDSNCLGADDTAGVWLMREMILCNIPGLYVFHRAEECGGVGSKHIANATPEMLSNIKHAIALDRKGTDSVITFQWSGRCCSDELAIELGKRLGDYKPDQWGSFTDTANYTKLVPECTNLSVGYRWEHSAGEELDVVHLLKLRKALLALNTDSLPIKRDPGKTEYRGGYGGYYEGGDYGGDYGSWKPAHGATRHVSAKKRAWQTAYCQDCYRSTLHCKCPPDKITAGTSMFAGREEDETPFNIKATIKFNPEAVIKMMRAWGFTDGEIMSELYQHGAALIGGPDLEDKH